MFPSPRDLPNPGIKSRSPTLQVDSLPAESQRVNLNKTTTRQICVDSTGGWKLILKVDDVNIY